MTALGSFETILVEKNEPIAVVTINRPEVLNALNQQALGELAAVMDSLRSEASIRGIILTGSGNKAFAAGSDMTELGYMTPAEAKHMAGEGQALTNRIENLGKPVIAALNGYALGAGCELALACTMRIAVAQACFNLPEVRMGLIPSFGGTQRLPRLVGKGPALQMILSGDMMDAQEALRIGLIDEIAPEGKLMDRAEAVLLTIASNGALAARYALEAVNVGMQMTQAQGLQLEAALYGLAIASEDAKEGQAAFLAGRKPRFKGH